MVRLVDHQHVDGRQLGQRGLARQRRNHAENNPPAEILGAGVDNRGGDFRVHGLEGGDVLRQQLAAVLQHQRPATAGQQAPDDGGEGDGLAEATRRNRQGVAALAERRQGALDEGVLAGSEKHRQTLPAET